ncbi:MAG TPA: endonuclease/exonuclease/phosphatase family protein [Streptosporangiaceae bacterium]
MTTVTVMTFNIHHGQGTDGVLDLARIARVIKTGGTGIAGLQEVDRHYGARSNWADQAAGLAALLGWQVAYGANIDRDPPAPGGPRVQYGNAVLSRYPIAHWQNTHLPGSAGAEQRGLLHAQIAVPGVPLHVYVTHLDAFSPADRVQQARQVVALVDGNCPAVLLGDFNARPDAPEIGTLRGALTDTWTAAAGGDPMATPPAGAPAARIDYIFTSRRLAAAWTRVGTADPAASDHAPVLSRLTLAASR